MAHSKVKDRISVLIPAFNAGSYLAEALESALSQKVDANLEVIVADDGSTDDTAEICARYPRVQYLYQENRGVSAARNLLLRKMTGDFAAFLDADDLWLPGKLAGQLSFLKEHPEVPFVGCEVCNFSGKVPEPPYKEDGNSVHYLIPCLIRKEVLKKTGLFREDLSVGEDSEYRFRMRSLGISGEAVIPEVYLLRRVHESNLSAASGRSVEKDLSAVLRKRIQEHYENRNRNIF